VSSRIDCWGGEKTEEGAEKSPERPSTSKGKQTLSATAHVNPQTLNKPAVAGGVKST